MYTIIVDSFTKFNTLEWAERVEGGSKQAAIRKANSLVRSCGIELSDIKSKRASTCEANVEIWVI